MNVRKLNKEWLLILFLSLPHYGIAQESRISSAEPYFQFHILYNHADSFSYDNYYYLKEKFFWSFESSSGEFRPFADDLFNGASPLGKINTIAGIGLRFKRSTTAHSGYPVRVLDKQYTSTNIYDSSAVHVIALGINKSNAAQYEYRLVLNEDTVIRGWSQFTTFKTIPENGYTYADLGTFLHPGNYLLLEVRHKKTLRDAGSIVLNWPRYPKLRVAQSRIYFKENNAMGTNGYFDAGMIKNGYATEKDSLTGVLKNLRLPGDKEYESFIFDLRDQEITFPYTAKLVRNIKGVADTVEINSYFNESTIKIPSYFLNKPGKFNLLLGSTYYFHYPDFDKWILKIPFEIQPAPVLLRKWTLREILPVSLLVILAIVLFFYFYYRRNKRKLKQVELEKQLNTLQLRSLQDQLNPHFLFNALSAIQNLIGKGDLENASLYLQRFSVLTRTILANSQQELISLEDDLNILQSYLEMEQLRTSFKFRIEVDKKINTANTEIPVMLLQPFVENAVKHGVSSLDREGLILLKVVQSDQTLTFIVNDNGKGIKAKEQQDIAKGWGLDVLKKRVYFLNEMYGYPVVNYQIQSDSNGTTVEINLKKWFN
jgi:two-component system LytT family sensor kinase